MILMQFTLNAVVPSLWSLCRVVSFAPSGLAQIPAFHPRLTPWAAFFRRFAAGHLVVSLDLVSFIEADDDSETRFIAVVLRHAQGPSIAPGDSLRSSPASAQDDRI